ncbi:tetratricopeptide repeat protein [Ulvibacter antarcticus]|uniref:Tetratricopeptide repeat protein n=2 Tax=Ulvibacter antarcticus TaxID=442714 RepID=A0A3L9Z724_9FLAO|nr:tetratricopeptide repeat protein [Ulvibacter antarcticus]
MAQSDLLAKNYFEQGEFEKALTLYEKLYEKNPVRLDYFMALVETNQQLEDFVTAEKLLRDQINGRRIMPQLYVDLGYNFSLQNKDIEAIENYKKAIDMINEYPNYVYNVGKAFESYSLLEYAATVYENAMVINPALDYNIQLARIYGEQGKVEEMFVKYIDLIEKNPSGKNIAQHNFSMYVTNDPSNEANIILRKTLLQKLQKNPSILYNELLSWLFIQQKEYKKAFVQEKAIYKRTGDNLRGLGDLALIAIADDDYENAVPVVEFIIDNSATPEAKLQGYQYLLQIALKTTPEKEYASVKKQFEDLFETYGDGAETYLLQIDYNHFLAFKMGEKEIAISNLKKLSKSRLTSYQEARIKMELGDILVFDEKFNEALIYYSQIQRKVQSDVLAQEARFKVAQTSYFKGDFEWAQVQLDVLRKSASQLIANDAMELSLMIRDNSLEDSTQTALKKYARADLLSFQNKNIEAIAVLDEIIINHKGESIEDEALLKQGELYEKTEQYEKAEADYLKLIEFYNDDILSDDAHFRLAELYENHLNEPDKAKDLYEKLIYNFADSIYFVEARKRYRMLRGDAIN